MKIEDELKLSFYKQIAVIDEAHGVTVVQNQNSGKIFVRKTMHQYDRSVYDFIKNNRLRGIPSIIEIVEDNGELTVIEDYISGKTLDEIAEIEKSAIDCDETVRIITALCDILEPLHAHVPPIVHRDIKPSNIIMNNAGEIFLLDFNASRMVISGKSRDTELLGTAEYAAPEQYGFRQSDQRTDIYALGVLMRKLLTEKQCSDRSCSGLMDEIIEKATAMDPDSRYNNVGEFKRAIIECMEERMQTIKIDYSVVPQNDSKQKEQNHLSVLDMADYYLGGLPGLRSERIGTKIMAACWYVFLFVFGFFGVSKTEGWSHIKNVTMDIITFLTLFSFTLYLGNYLGVRDRLPWRKKSSLPADLIRVAAGCLILFAVIVGFGSIVMLALHIE